MQTTLLFLLLIVLLNSIFIFRFIQDLLKNWQDVKRDSSNTLLLVISSPIIFFGSALGISDFTLSTLFYRKMNLVSDKKLPGTLNTQCVIPVAVMAIAFISVIQVDKITLFACIISQMIGAYFGPRFVVRFSLKSIRLIIGMGLLLSTLFILAGKFNLMPYGGSAIELSNGKLIVAMTCLMIFGAFNSLGVGSYTPTLVTLYTFGINPLAAFPIIMGASTFAVPLSSMQFIKYGLYSKKITLIASLFGVLGALIGVYFVHSLDMSMLQWLIAAISFYSGSSLLINEFKSDNSSESIEGYSHANS